MNIFFLIAVEDSLEAPGGYLSDEFTEAVANWRAIDVELSHPLLDKASTGISDKIRKQAFRSYINESSDKLDLEGSKTRTYAMQMASWVESNTKKLNKRFKNPITE
jgi:hypothetical protein